jgi:hypothetical protein
VSATTTPPAPEFQALAPYAGPLLATVRASNGAFTIPIQDWIAGVLMVGGQGSGKSAVMVRHAINATRDPHAAVIVCDPKTTLARRMLGLIPPDCGKRVWYLRLGRPAFGMSPLKVDAPWQAITDLMVEALRDVMGDQQIFQSSRAVIERSTAAALALAKQRGQPPEIEDLRGLMLPEEQGLRNEAILALKRSRGLDLVADFFEVELPGELEHNRAAMRQRLQAPRNKIDALLNAESLRVFFNHPYELPLGEIVRNRDVLVIDADVAATGDENARLVLSFILRQLEVVLNQQLASDPADRSRVHLFVDEADFVLNETLARMLAKHRESGLTVTLALQYMGQLRDDLVRHGVEMLAQSRYLFRISDPLEAEVATRLAHAVLSPRIETDPDSRGRMRIAPEVALSLERFHCIASWITAGTRIPAFIGRTYPIPTAYGYTDYHLARQTEEVGDYPERLIEERELARVRARNARRGGEPEPDTAEESPTTPLDPRHSAPSTGASSRPGRRAETADAGAGIQGDPAEPPGELRPEHVPAPPPRPRPASRDHTPTPARRAPGPSTATSPPGAAGPDWRLVPESHTRSLFAAFKPAEDTPRGEAPQSIRNLARIDRINGIGAFDQHDSDRPVRLSGADMGALLLLDRFGALMKLQLEHLWASPRSANNALARLWRAGLLARAEIELLDRGAERKPHVYALTLKGFETAKNPPGRRQPVIHARRQWRAVELGKGLRLAHDLHSVEWLFAFHRVFGEICTQFWRTPRLATGRFQPPRVDTGRGRRREFRIGDLELPKHLTVAGLATYDFTELKPDLSIEVSIKTVRPPLVTDVLVELNRTGGSSHNRPKLAAYDAFLTGWCLGHLRYRQRGHRPVLLFVARDTEDAIALLRVADEVMVGQFGVTGTDDPTRWYYAGRDHPVVMEEEEIHHGSVGSWALPPLPRHVRRDVEGTDELIPRRVSLLPQQMARLRGGSSRPDVGRDRRQ